MIKKISRKIKEKRSKNKILSPYKKINKKLLNKKDNNKLKKIKHNDDYIVSSKFLIFNDLNNKIDNLREKINKYKGSDEEFFLETKFILIETKLRALKLYFDKEEFNKLNNLIKNIEKELK